MTTLAPHTKVLLIDDDPASSECIRAALATPDEDLFPLLWVRQLSDGLERLGKRDIAAVLLALDLPDSQGMATFDKLFAAAPGIPILILGGNGSQALVHEAVRRGAQDYLLPDHLDAYSVPRALRNAIERKTVEDALYLERERALVTLNSIGDAVLSTDISGDITYINGVAETMTGWSRTEAIGKPLTEVFRIIDGSTRKSARNPLEMAREQNGNLGLTGNGILIRRDGSESPIEDSAAPVYDRAGQVIGAVIVFHDVSKARAMSRRMTYTAQHDAVTNLPNRTLINERISQSITRARRQGKQVAVLFLDLDRFKNINDSLGHAVGDQLLQSVSKRLLANVRDSDTVSRLGGDEFIILLSEIDHPDDAASSARNALLSLRAAHSIGGQDLHIDGSIGISVYPGDGEDAETLIKNADTAMYHAKEKGRNNFQFFKAEMNRKAVRRQSLEGGLRRALEREEFVLHYQPKVNLESAEISGIEALLRWRQPSCELVLPAQFLPIAEEAGLMLQIGRWVMREACTQARAWQDAGHLPVPMAVNVSASEFRDRDFVTNVRKILSETRLEARFLELELTEGRLMDNVESMASVLQELKSMGVRMAIDDFGTGYSSLSYLQHFPIDVLKIDQSFVRQLTDNPGDSTIVNAIINIGQGLKHLVVAEGIETQKQRAYLQNQCCAEGQGYLFSKPLAAAEFADLLEIGMTRALLY